MICKNCGSQIRNNTKFCPGCGQKVGLFCKNCGAEIKPGMKFCGICGFPINAAAAQKGPIYHRAPSAVPNHTQQIRHQKQTQSRLRFLPVFVFTSILLALAGGSAYLFFSSPAYELSEELKDGNYEDAVELYNNEISDSAIQSALSTYILSRHMESLKKNLSDEDISYAEAFSAISALQKLDDKEIASKTRENMDEISKINKAQTAFSAAENYYKQENYSGAIQQYQQITEDMPNYKDAQTKLEECKQKYKADVMSKTASLSTLEEYKRGISILQIAANTFPEDQEIRQRKSEIESAYLVQLKQDTMEQVNAAIDVGDYSKALNLLKNVDAKLASDADISSMYDSTVTAYETDVINRAVSLSSEGKYGDALQLIKQASAQLPNSSKLTTVYQNINDERPVKLNELKISESNEAFVHITEQVITEDTLGNIYNPGNLFAIDDRYAHGGYAKYYLGGAYQKLSFLLAVSDENPDDKDWAALTVYGNEDQILYTSNSLTRTSVPRQVEIDVSGYDWLYFRADSDSYWAVTLLIADPVLYK